MHLAPVAAERNINDAAVNKMIVFLRRIPANTKKHEISDYLEPILKGGLLQKSGRIENIKILVMKDTQTNALEFHGLVKIDLESAAQRVIKKLNRKVFKGKNIAVREYFYRTWHNDPRMNMHEWNEELANKRKGDRRRTRLEVEADLTNSFTTNENFHRSL